jgi:hypothetical protein
VPLGDYTSIYLSTLLLMAISGLGLLQIMPPEHFIHIFWCPSTHISVVYLPYIHSFILAFSRK